MTNVNESENAYMQELKSLLKDKFFMLLLGISAAIVILSTFYSFIKPGEADVKIASITKESASTTKQIDAKSLNDALVTLTPTQNPGEVNGVEDDIFDNEGPQYSMFDGIRKFLGLNRDVEVKKQADSSNISLNDEQSTEVIVSPTIKETETLAMTTDVEPSITLQPTSMPTVEPTKVPTIVEVTVQPTATQVVAEVQKTVDGEREYVVQSGDSLWSIAEKMYNSGFNYVDIINTNGITNPSRILVGQKLKLPKVTVRTAQTTGVITVSAASTRNEVSVPSTYTVQRGDSLWTIAASQLGSGYKWSTIAKLNGLANPRIIHRGQVLRLK